MALVSDSTRTIQFDPDSLAATYGYDGSGNLTSQTVQYGGTVLVKTFTYTSGRLSGESAWVKQ